MAGYVRNRQGRDDDQASAIGETSTLDGLHRQGMSADAWKFCRRSWQLNLCGLRGQLKFPDGGVDSERHPNCTNAAAQNMVVSKSSTVLIGSYQAAALHLVPEFSPFAPRSSRLAPS